MLRQCAEWQGGGKVVNSIERSGNVKYRVEIGISGTIALVFDCIGDAADMVTTCLENGYRATVIPVNENITPAYEKEDVE